VSGARPETRMPVDQALREWARWLWGLVLAAVAALERAKPVRVLAVLVVAEWLVVAELARRVRHAGWIFYQGGDQLWYFTTGWLLAHGKLPQTPIGYLWPAILSPFAAVGGPDLVESLPAIVLLNVLVLLPIAMLALYGIAARIGGRLFGYWTLLLWIVVPLIGIRFTNFGYHQRYTELLLPQGLGLTALADFSTMVATIVAAYFCLRALVDQRPRTFDGVAAGLAAGAAIGIKPATALFLAGPILAFAFGRRWRLAATFVVSIAPALIVLAVWKERGLGYLPAFSSGAAVPLAAGTHVVALGGIHLGRYVNLDWQHLQDNIRLIQEHFWSSRVIEWLVIGGAIGLARRSRPALLLVVGWFAAFVIVKGTYAQASVEDGSIFRILMPIFPAFVLLLACVPLLLPGMPRRLRPWTPALPSPSSRTRWTLAGAALAVTAVIPLAAIAAASPVKGPKPAAAALSQMPVPIDVDLGVSTAVSANGVSIAWRKQSPLGGPVFYRVLRGRDDMITCPPASAAEMCTLSMPEVGVTRDAAFEDKPPRGRWTYRIAVAANWLNDPAYGDVYFIGAPVSVVVR
jgi:hypothetical protein